MKVRVVRPFYVGGVRKEVGEVADLPNALEIIATGRAERMPGDIPNKAGPMTTETASEIVDGKKRKQKE